MVLLCCNLPSRLCCGSSSARWAAPRLLVALHGSTLLPLANLNTTHQAHALHHCPAPQLLQPLELNSLVASLGVDLDDLVPAQDHLEEPLLPRDEADPLAAEEEDFEDTKVTLPEAAETVEAEIKTRTESL